jgi:hypothetical protein
MKVKIFVLACQPRLCVMYRWFVLLVQRLVMQVCWSKVFKSIWESGCKCNRLGFPPVTNLHKVGQELPREFREPLPSKLQWPNSQPAATAIDLASRWLDSNNKRTRSAFTEQNTATIQECKSTHVVERYPEPTALIFVQSTAFNSIKYLWTSKGSRICWPFSVRGQRTVASVVCDIETTFG